MTELEKEHLNNAPGLFANEGFIAGAKWAEKNSEKKFTKEDMLDAFNEGYSHAMDAGGNKFSTWLKQNYEK